MIALVKMVPLTSICCCLLWLGAYGRMLVVKTTILRSLKNHLRAKNETVQLLRDRFHCTFHYVKSRVSIASTIKNQLS